MRNALLILLVALGLSASAAIRHVGAEEAIDLGSRRELFVDDHLIARLSGEAGLRLHKPAPREVALVTDKPWEGNTCAYYTIFQDGDLYRMYYRGSHFDEQTGKAGHREVVCYAESKDGVGWTKPNLGLFEFEGSKENNIVWDGVGTHNFTPFKDTRPDCPKEAQYKAFGGGRGGLMPFQSADGIHWKLMADRPVVTKGAFDSQNLAFWDPVAKRYREYHRIFTGGVRAIATGESDDFLEWSDPAPLVYDSNPPNEHLYTNAIAPYARAPHLLLGFPTRFHPSRESQVEPILMTSRDGRNFRRWSEALIPVTAPEDRSGNRSNYMAWGLVELPSSPGELSCYATEAYYRGPDSRLRRFVWRVDGFVSLSADAAGGEAITKPLTFAGNSLKLNYATRDGGEVRVEIQDESGAPLEGFSFADGKKLQGDEIAQTFAWTGGADLSKLAGKGVRLRFALKDADVYSFRFSNAK